MSDKKNMRIGVSIAKLVIAVSEAKVNEKIELDLITGAVPANIKYKRRSDNVLFDIDEDSSVTFAEPGVYQLVVLTYTQHISYDITITE